MSEMCNGFGDKRGHALPTVRKQIEIRHDGIPMCLLRPMFPHVISPTHSHTESANRNDISPVSCIYNQAKTSCVLNPIDVRHCPESCLVIAAVFFAASVYHAP